MFRLDKVSVRYGEAEVLHVEHLDISQTGLLTVVGPNGAGKSTLLSILAGFRPHFGGACLFAGEEVRRVPRKRFARSVSFIPQTVDMHFPFTAEQVVMMGRTPYCDGMFEAPEDWRHVEEAMTLTDTLVFRGRDFRSLSGGEKQRVVLAAALAQTPSVLLLDEPTTYLDLKHQLATYRLLANLARQGMLVIAVTHDLNLAASFSDRVLVLDHGRPAADGDPWQALTPEVIRSVFEVEARVAGDSFGRPRIDYGCN